MSNSAAMEAFGLKFNPFPPAATGVAFRWRDVAP